MDDQVTQTIFLRVRLKLIFAGRPAHNRDKVGNETRNGTFDESVVAKYDVLFGNVGFVQLNYG